MRTPNELPIRSRGVATSVLMRDGAVAQIRYYNADGWPLLNIDFDHDHGAGKPHAHDWERAGQLPRRQPGRPITRSEEEHVRVCLANFTELNG